MADEKTLDILRLGVVVWNDWYEPKRRGASLAEAELRCRDFAGINFSNANLERADLQYANLSGANLQNARLLGARLGRANLCGACLRSAVGLSQAQLDQAQGNSRTVLPHGVQHPSHWVEKVNFWEPGVAEPAQGNVVSTGRVRA